MTRCFIALVLPENIREELVRVQGELEKQKLFRGKLTEPENIHLTLKFLGKLSKERIEAVKERLDGAKLKKGMMRLGGCGVFSPEYVRIIWAHLEGVGELQKAVDDALEGLYEKENWFMSHITIARVKGLGDKKALMKYVEGMKLRPLEAEAKTVAFMKSELTPKGPVYTPIKNYELG